MRVRRHEREAGMLVKFDLRIYVAEIWGNDRYWLKADYPAMSPLGPLIPQQETFDGRCPLRP